MITVRVTRKNGAVVAAYVVENPDFNHRSIELENRNDWKSIQEADAVAHFLPGYIATDAGAHVSPRYDVQRLPAVGDLVSYAFNGDSYPCGKITRVSGEAGGYRRIEATDENGVKRVFHRRRASGSWIKDQTWSLVQGHHNKRNPEF